MTKIVGAPGLFRNELWATPRVVIYYLTPSEKLVTDVYSPVNLLNFGLTLWTQDLKPKNTLHQVLGNKQVLIKP